MSDTKYISLGRSKPLKVLKQFPPQAFNRNAANIRDYRMVQKQENMSNPMWHKHTKMYQVNETISSRIMHQIVAKAEENEQRQNTSKRRKQRFINKRKQSKLNNVFLKNDIECTNYEFARARQTPMKPKSKKRSNKKRKNISKIKQQLDYTFNENCTKKMLTSVIENSTEAVGFLNYSKPSTKSRTNLKNSEECFLKKRKSEIIIDESNEFPYKVLEESSSGMKNCSYDKQDSSAQCCIVANSESSESSPTPFTSEESSCRENQSDSELFFFDITGDYSQDKSIKQTKNLVSNIHNPSANLILSQCSNRDKKISPQHSQKFEINDIHNSISFNQFNFDDLRDLSDSSEDIILEHLNEGSIESKSSGVSDDFEIVDNIHSKNKKKVRENCLSRDYCHNQHNNKKCEVPNNYLNSTYNDTLEGVFSNYGKRDSSLLVVDESVSELESDHGHRVNDASRNSVEQSKHQNRDMRYQIINKKYETCKTKKGKIKESSFKSDYITGLSGKQCDIPETHEISLIYTNGEILKKNETSSSKTGKKTQIDYNSGSTKLLDEILETKGAEVQEAYGESHKANHCKFGLRKEFGIKDVQKNIEVQKGIELEDEKADFWTNILSELKIVKKRRKRKFAEMIKQTLDVQKIERDCEVGKIETGSSEIHKNKQFENNNIELLREILGTETHRKNGESYGVNHSELELRQEDLEIKDVQIDMGLQEITQEIESESEPVVKRKKKRKINNDNPELTQDILNISTNSVILDKIKTSSLKTKKKKQYKDSENCGLQYKIPGISYTETQYKKAESYETNENKIINKVEDISAEVNLQQRDEIKYSNTIVNKKVKKKQKDMINIYDSPKSIYNDRYTDRGNNHKFIEKSQTESVTTLSSEEKKIEESVNRIEQIDVNVVEAHKSERLNESKTEPLEKVLQRCPNLLEELKNNVDTSSGLEFVKDHYSNISPKQTMSKKQGSKNFNESNSHSITKANFKNTEKHNQSPTYRNFGESLTEINMDCHFPSEYSYGNNEKNPKTYRSNDVESEELIFDELGKEIRDLQANEVQIEWKDLMKVASNRKTKKVRQKTCKNLIHLIDSDCEMHVTFNEQNNENSGNTEGENDEKFNGEKNNSICKEFVDIIDSDCTMSTTLTDTRKKRANKRNNVRKNGYREDSELSNDRKDKNIQSPSFNVDNSADMSGKKSEYKEISKIYNLESESTENNLNTEKQVQLRSEGSIDSADSPRKRKKKNHRLKLNKSVSLNKLNSETDPYIANWPEKNIHIQIHGESSVVNDKNEKLHNNEEFSKNSNIGGNGYELQSELDEMEIQNVQADREARESYQNIHIQIDGESSVVNDKNKKLHNNEEFSKNSNIGGNGYELQSELDEMEIQNVQADREAREIDLKNVIIYSADQKISSKLKMKKKKRKRDISNTEIIEPQATQNIGTNTETLKSKLYSKNRQPNVNLNSTDPVQFEKKRKEKPKLLHGLRFAGSDHIREETAKQNDAVVPSFQSSESDELKNNDADSGTESFNKDEIHFVAELDRAKVNIQETIHGKSLSYGNGKALIKKIVSWKKEHFHKNPNESSGKSYENKCLIPSDLCETSLDETIHCEENKTGNKSFQSENIENNGSEEFVIEEEFDPKNLSLAVPFSIPPLHEHLADSKQELEAVNLGITLKKGSFNKEEDKQITDNWAHFCKFHNLSVSPEMFFNTQKMRLAERLKFLQFLAHGLEKRKLQRVHMRFKTLFKKNLVRRGRYTAEEDAQILDYLRNTKSVTPYKDLAEMLNRTNLSVQRRYETLTKAKNTGNLEWNVDSMAKFVAKMMRIKKVKGVSDLKDVVLTTKQWKKISKKMDYIPIERLRRAWKVTIHPRLFVESVDIVQMKKDIVETLYESDIDDWKIIDWKSISEKYAGFTAEKVYMMFRQMMHHHVPEEKRGDVRECLSYLKHNIVDKNKLMPSHTIKRLVVEVPESEDTE